MVFLQLIFNSLVAGVLLAVVALGFNFVFSTTKVFHLAHGAVYVCGAYSLLFFLQRYNLGRSPLFCFIAVLLALGVTVLIAVLIEVFVYQPLIRKKASQAISLISSLGVYILLTNFIALAFGNETKLQDIGLGGGLVFGSLVLMPVQLVELGTGLLLVWLIWRLSKRPWYIKVRALWSNEEAAAVMGVNAGMLRISVMSLGAVLAAVAAVLRLYDTGIDPQAGMEITLSAVVAVIIGGNGSITGTVAAALLIAFLQAFVEYFFSAQWKEGVTFLMLIAVIMARTEGIVSFKLRVEEK
jgi:branched-chain amino acid transport system permease protein